MKKKVSRFEDNLDILVDKDAFKNPFLFSQCDIIQGHCHALVIAVGKNTKWGSLILQHDPPPIPLTPTQDR